MGPIGNSLFDALPSSVLENLRPKLNLVSVHRGQVLFGLGERPKHVFFPISSIVSMINDLPDGSTIEIHMLGRTCLVGAGAIDAPSFYRATVSVSGLAFRLSMLDLQSLRESCPAYSLEAQKRMGLLMSHIAQRVICHSNHLVSEQIIRWILLMLDRMTDSNIQITHSDLALLIGCRREAVTLALGKLNKEGLIEMTRNLIHIPNREALESVSCDCYWNGLKIAHPKLKSSSNETNPVWKNYQALSKKKFCTQIQAEIVAQFHPTGAGHDDKRCTLPRPTAIR